MIHLVDIDPDNWRLGLKVALCYVDGNDVAKQMYEKFGFVETERDGNEIVMERTL